MLKTKLTIPPLRQERLLPRQLLMDRLNEGLQSKLTTVIAPSGYGKTTAFIQWANQCAHPVAWLSLDRLDNDWHCFWSHVLAAIQQIDPAVGQETSACLAAMERDRVERLGIALLQDLHKIDREIILILDDLHLIDHASIYETLAYLLEYLPPHVHIYAASRQKLSLPLARLLAQGQWHQIEMRDLILQHEDSVGYLRNKLNLPLKEEEIWQLLERTEGWFSGIHLAALSLQRCGDPSGFLASFSGQQRDIASYLMEEFIAKLPLPKQEFLLRTSILSRMNGALCRAVTGRTDSELELEQLQQHNMLIFPLDHDHGWYRYHQLFGEFLQQQLRQRLPEQWSDLHAAAAQWYEAHQQHEEAVEHYLEGGHYEEAAFLLGQHAQEWHRRRAMLNRWLSRLPTSILHTSPDLQFLSFKLHVEAGEIEHAELELGAIRNRLDQPEWQPWAPSLLFMSSELAFYRKNISLAHEYLELFDASAPQGIPLQMLGGNTLRGVNYESLLTFFNGLKEAESFLRTWVERWGKRDNYPFAGYLNTAYGELLLEWNRVEEAEMVLSRTRQDTSIRPYGRIMVNSTIQYAYYLHVRGDTTAAVQNLLDVKQLIHSNDRDLFIKKLEASRAYLFLLQGNTEPALAWLEDCGLTPSDVVPFYRFTEYLHYARALRATGALPEAIQLLQRMYLQASHQDRKREQIKSLIQLSLAHFRQGDVSQAATHLEIALHLAEPQNYLRSFLDEGSAMADLLAAYLRLRQNNLKQSDYNVSLAYVKRLLHSMNIKNQVSNELPILLTAQEVRILRAAEEGLLNREMADRFHISSETVKIHLKNIYRKLGVSRRIEALQQAEKLNLL